MATLLPLGVALFMTKPLWLVKELNIQAPSANSTMGRTLMERAMTEIRGSWETRGACSEPMASPKRSEIEVSYRKWQLYAERGLMVSTP
jgi:hypothetical protein